MLLCCVDCNKTMQSAHTCEANLKHLGSKTHAILNDLGSNAILDAPRAVQRTSCFADGGMRLEVLIERVIPHGQLFAFPREP